ncbi:MAG: hypothetical protein BIFFINMI_01160 [Phycisphaerae bacterium]|nr:hypothetical protein [Phycisphaerae bacterium]
MPQCADILSDLTAEELARRARDGSPACFDALVDRYARRLWAYLRRRGLGEHDADDLTQETFLRAYRFLHRYDSSQRFAPWLFTIATRQAADFFRSHRPTNDLDGVEPTDRSAAAPGDALAAREQAGRLWSLADQLLSPGQRQALWLMYVERMSVREIAKVTRRTGVSVKVMLHRARRRLLASPGVRALLPDAGSAGASAPDEGMDSEVAHG